MRFCYHIQSHRSPAQILRLVHQIKRMSPHSVVHISHDANGATLDTRALALLADVHVQLHPGGYGDFSHVDRHLLAIDWLATEGIHVDWLVNLTGQDYPLVHLADAEAELASSGADGFLEYWPALGPQSHWGVHRARSRYYFRHRHVMPLSLRAKRVLRPVQVVNRLQPFVRVHVAYGLVVGRRVRTPFGPDLVLHGGSAFMSLTWPTALYLRDFLRRRPDVVSHFRHTLSPVEAITQTVLANAPGLRLVPDPKRYFDFTHSQFNHPKTLTAEDLPRALASGAHFGRKFDADAYPETLDALDAHLAALSPAQR
jgi:hypothetical protein